MHSVRSESLPSFHPVRRLDSLRSAYRPFLGLFHVPTVGLSKNEATSKRHTPQDHCLTERGQSSDRNLSEVFTEMYHMTEIFSCSQPR